MTVDYRPRGMTMWDTWYLEHGGQAHVFHLQRRAPISLRDPAEATWLGHAVSDDLIHWQELPLALGPGTPEALDELQPWTGCVVAHERKFYMYYTMRTSVGDGFGQRIGLATSDDLIHWVRHPGNPVIVPDPRWYIGHDDPLARHVVDCRDLIVVPDPDRRGWLGFYAARVPAEEEAETSVIAAVRSPDLIAWEHLPPAWAPRKYACIEVPDVFFLDGKWYMICLSNTALGNRGTFSDPYVTRGTVYAVADHPLGPYQELDGDNTLMGGTKYAGYSCRSLLFDGELHMFYTQVTPDGNNTLSPPMLVRSLPDGRLRLAYSPRTKAWRRESIIAPGDQPPVAHLPFSTRIWPLHAGRWVLEGGVYQGESRTGWQVADLGVGAANVEMEARLTLKQGIAAGLVLRSDTSMHWPGGKDIVFALDAEQGIVLAATLSTFDELGRRRHPIRPGQTYHMRVCIRPPRFEVYVDDILVLDGAAEFPQMPRPSVGLFVDRGQVEMAELEAYSLADEWTPVILRSRR